MKAGPHFQKTDDAAVDLDLSGGGFGDLRKDLEERTLPGAVAADDPHDVPRLDVERHVLEGPEGFLGSHASREGFEAPEGVRDESRESFAKRGIALLARTDLVLLTQIFDTNCRVGHSKVR